MRLRLSLHPHAEGFMLTVWCLVTQRRASQVFGVEPAGSVLHDAVRRLTLEVSL